MGGDFIPRDTKTIGVRLPYDINAILEHYCRKKHITKSDLIRNALIDYLYDSEIRKD